MQDVNVSGSVVWFDDLKGFGFLRVDGQEVKDVFCHFRAIEGEEGHRTLTEGQRVQFDIVLSERNKGNLEAANVRIIS